VAELDAAAEEADEIAKKGRKMPRRERRPKTGRLEETSFNGEETMSRGGARR
jgi:hypothetical protein